MPIATWNRPAAPAKPPWRNEATPELWQRTGDFQRSLANEMNTLFLRLRYWLKIVAVFAFATASHAVIPAPEKLLPDDTLALLTAPDFARLRAIWDKLPQRQLWNDPAMKPFHDNFLTKWKDEFVKPLESELDVKFADYTSLFQGQVTLALTQNGWQGGSGQPPAFVLLLDTKDKSNQLKKNLSALRKKWVDGGKPVRTTKIRDYDFTILPLSSNDVPKTLRKFFPKSSEVHELGEENTPPAPAPADELVLGQVESLLILSSSSSAAEKIVARVAGGGVPPLADLALYQTDHAALFRESPLYGWLNIKSLFEIFFRKSAEKKDNPDAPNPFDLKPEKILSALGIDGLKTLAVRFNQVNEGSLLEVLLGAPESSRQGLLRILAGEPRESKPPSFVPADVSKFQRWRIDGQKTWETIQKIANDISPQWLGGINFLIETANTAAKDKDPGFDLKRNLIGNLGDDLIAYEKKPPGNSVADRRSPPSLFLVGSPNADALAASLKSVLIYLSQQAGVPPDEREFLGRKIYSIPLKSMAMPLGAGAGAGPAVPPTLTYAASGGYVALSTDPALVEEYLRSSDGQHSQLAETPGLADAAQKVLGPGSSMFGYENQVETTRTVFEAMRKNAGGTANSPPGAVANLLPTAMNLTATVQSFRDLMDFSLLPPFDSIAKYFHFSVYGGGASVDGLSLKLFVPVPPGAKPGEAPQH